MNVIQDLKERLLTARCEDCGAKALHAALELAECEPVCVGGELYARHEIAGRHFFCGAHRKTYEPRPWRPPEGWTPPADWPVTVAEVLKSDPHR